MSERKIRDERDEVSAGKIRDERDGGDEVSAGEIGDERDESIVYLVVTSMHRTHWCI